MGEVSNELCRMERIEKGERLRKKVREREKARNEKVVGEIVVEILRKMEKVRKEESRLEMREIKNEIVR